MFVPRLHRPEFLAPLQAEWKRGGSVRVEPLLLEAHAARFLAALRSVEHVPMQRFDAKEGFQAWRFGWVPGTDDCDHPLCILGRWLTSDGLKWVSALTERDLMPAPDPTLISDCAAKASFFEAYNDASAGRAVALRLHLTPTMWPAEWGGHLELLDGPEGAVVDRRAPAWNTLDLFDVRGPAAWRRLPLIQKHLEGYTISAWFHEAA